ncbi:MAG: type II secretion system GspH family protein [Kangiellaceae bacterium]|nr:type II secretion system GspH family protein [Kangiellaceae bacterium]
MLSQTRFKKPPFKQAAFTLLELIVVIVVLSILAVYVQARFQDDDSYQKDVAVEQLISLARLTQQLAMNDSSRAFLLNIQTNQIDLLADGVSLAGSVSGVPVNLSSKVTLAPASNISFNSLGETTATTITVTVNTTQNVCIESSGYVRRC